MNKTVTLVLGIVLALGFMLAGCRSNMDPTPPQLTGIVSIDGIAQVGRTLAADTSALGGNGTVSFEWRWGDTVIGTDSTLALTTGHEGAMIVVTASRAGYLGSVTSASPVGPVIGAPNYDNKVPGNTLAEQLAWLREHAQNGNTYVVEISSDENIDPSDMLPGLGHAGVTIILRGRNAMRTVGLSANGTLFSVGAGVTLVLDGNVTLQGRNDNDNPLVAIRIGGTLVMNSGSVITGNAAWDGGGVSVTHGGTFAINGGEISGNTARRRGGGVYVDGMFIIRGGEIAGNTAEIGGGVYIGRNGNLRMSDGVIHGVESAEELRNTSIESGATLKNGGAAWYGTFDPVTGEFTQAQSSGVLPTTSSTIRVANGVLQTLVQGGSFAEQLAWLRVFARSGGEYSVELRGDEKITSAQAELPVGRGDISITLRGSGGMRTISLCGTGSMFTVGSGLTLTLDDSVTFKGADGHFMPLVDVTGGTLVMNKGTTVTGNASAGVSVGGGGTFAMHGGEISGNGGGVSVRTNGTFNMHGGEISGNASSGVSVGGGNGTFTMHGGEIYGNTANFRGGGVIVGSGIFTMHGGNIFGNTAGSGGGVSIERDGTFYMHGGAIFDNIANSGGGGVLVEWNGIFTMHGGSISGNTAGRYGGGVQGSVRIINGTVYGNESAVATVLRNTAPEGAALYGTAYGGRSGDIDTFGPIIVTTDNSIRAVSGVLQMERDAAGNVKVPRTSLWQQVNWLQSWALSGGRYLVQLNDDEDGGFRLAFDGRSDITITLRGTGEMRAIIGLGIWVYHGITLVLDNNVTLQGREDNFNTLVRVNGGTLIMNDGSAITGNTVNGFGSGGGVSVGGNGTFVMHGGKIYGNSARNGGGVIVFSGGTFTMHDGKINNNSSAQHGGGVHVYPGGTFAMKGGEISGNTASMGAGVCVGRGGRPATNHADGMFVMHGGNIFGNTASFGGGVAVDRDGTFDKRDGILSGNTASSGGGGVFIVDGTFDMRGGEIFGNTAGNHGGGVSVQSGIFNISDGVVYGNELHHGERGNRGSVNCAALNLFRSDSSTAQHGTFCVSGGSFYTVGFLGTTNNTIRVRDGVLFVLVTGIIGVPTSTMAGTPLALNAAVVPANATNQAIAWSVQNAGTTGAAISGNTLNTTAAGTATIRATIVDGLAVGIPFVQDFAVTVNPLFIPVANISNVPNTATVGIPLVLTGTVAPANATNRAVTWGVADAETTGATIAEGNIFTATNPGIARVRAIVANGTAPGTYFTMDFTVSVQPAFVPVYEITGVPVSMMAGTSLVLAGAVVPDNATNGTIAWSVHSAGTTGANISSGNTLNAASVGTATVRATIVNGTALGTNFVRDFEIAVIAVPLITWEASPVGNQTTTAINFYFSADPGLMFETNITISSVTGSATRSILSGTGTTRTLTVFNVVAGTVSVSISRTGIASGSQTVAVVAPDVTWIANASGNPVTTAINFSFSRDPGPLVAANIAVTSGSGSATRGVLSGTGTTRTLTVTPVSAGTVSVSINRSGIAGGPETVTILRPTVTGVTVSPPAATVARGGTQGFTATVAGTGNPPQAVNWTIDGGGPSTINSGGVLTVNANENRAALTVRATSTVAGFTNVSGTATVTLTGVPGTTLADRLAWLRANAQSGGEYLLEISGNEVITPAQAALPAGRTNLTITLRGGGGMQSISLPAAPGTANEGSIFAIGSGVTLVLDSNVTLQGRNNNDSLVRVGNGGALVMNDGSVITGNRGTIRVYGGGVRVENGGVFTMNGGEISDNIGNISSSGGGVFVDSAGIFTMYSGVISGNRVGQNGGGVLVVGTLNMRGGTIRDNIGSGPSFSGAGGGGVVNVGTFNMCGGTISGNSAPAGFGGGVGNTAIFNMRGGTISGNTAGINAGGGGVANSGTFNMHAGIISVNSTGGGGGGVRNEGTFVMHDGTISGNYTQGSMGVLLPSGGGVWNSGVFDMRNGTISDNRTYSGSATGGGGVFNRDGIFTMYNGTISGNVTRFSGGGVRVYTGYFYMHGGTISGNDVRNGGGGGIGVLTGTFRISNGIIHGNEETLAAGLRNTVASGGAALSDFGLGTVQRGTFSNGVFTLLETLPSGVGGFSVSDTIEVMNGILIRPQL